MKPEIKNRIKQIKNGEIPEGYKKTKVGIIPNDWEVTHLKQYFTRLTTKNTENNSNVLTISAQYGLINQSDFFNKEVASDDKSNYYLLKKGEFAYNKSYSNGYPYGAIKKLRFYENGIVSPLYICFCANTANKCPDYFEYYFEAGRLNKEIKAFAQEGARNHGLLNIPVSDFFHSYIAVPKISEQQKIVEILTAQDKVIELKEKLIFEKERQKKYLMQQLLTGKKRLKGFSGEWKNIRVSDIFKLTRGLVLPTSLIKNEPDVIYKYPVYSSQTKNNGLLGYFNEYLYENAITWTTDGANAGFVCYRNGQFYCTNVCGVLINNDGYANKCIAEILNSITKKYVSYVGNPKLMNNTMGEINIKIPPLDEQNAIAEILSKADKEIELLKQDLEQEKLKKKALMQLLLTGIVRV